MTTSSDKNDPLNLSSLDFGPAWARKKDPNAKPRTQRKSFDKGRKGGQGGPKGKGRPHKSREGRDQAPRKRVPAAEGIKIGIMPLESAIDSLVKEVQESNNTFSIFDLARIILKDREKFNVAFEADEKTELFQFKADSATFLTKEEALKHLATLEGAEDAQFDELVVTSKKVFVPSTISFKIISKALASSLLTGISEQVRYPGELSSFLCRQLTGRQLAVFKWQGKLHAGPSRPHQITEEIQQDEATKAIIQWATDNSGAKEAKLWEALGLEDAALEAHKTSLETLLKGGFLSRINQGGLHLSSDSKKKPVRKAPAKEAKSEASTETVKPEEGDTSEKA